MEFRLNEKSERNRIIYLQKISGRPVVEIAAEYGLSMPRIHRICLKEENKALKIKNQQLIDEIEELKKKNDWLFRYCWSIIQIFNK